MSDDLPGFDFPKAEVISAETPKPVGIAEMTKILSSLVKSSGPRSFEITMDGAVKVTGYSPDEVGQFLKNYREHVVAFTKDMNGLQAMIESNPLHHPGGYR